MDAVVFEKGELGGCARLKDRSAQRGICTNAVLLPAGSVLLHAAAAERSVENIGQGLCATKSERARLVNVCGFVASGRRKASWDVDWGR